VILMSIKLLVIVSHIKIIVVAGDWKLTGQ